MKESKLENMKRFHVMKYLVRDRLSIIDINYDYVGAWDGISGQVNWYHHEDIIQTDTIGELCLKLSEMYPRRVWVTLDSVQEGFYIEEYMGKFRSEVYPHHMNIAPVDGYCRNVYRNFSEQEENSYYPFVSEIWFKEENLMGMSCIWKAEADYMEEIREDFWRCEED